MYTQARWPAEGLRWIGSLLLRAAERIERTAARDDLADAPLIDRLPDERIDDARSRLYSRYF